MKENEGILKIKRMVNDTCISYEGENQVSSCIKCNNAVYRFIYSNGRQTGDDTYYKKGIKEEKYLIEFFDKVPTSVELEKYLLDKKSNYRITRLKDNKVIRLSTDEKNMLESHYDQMKIKQEESYREYLAKVEEAKIRKKSL